MHYDRQGIVQLTRGPATIVEHDGMTAKFRARVVLAAEFTAAVAMGVDAGKDVGIIEDPPLAAGAALIFAAPMLTVISVG